MVTAHPYMHNLLQLLVAIVVVVVVVPLLEWMTSIAQHIKPEIVT
jgi:hypothetical protein